MFEIKVKASALGEIVNVLSTVVDNAVLQLGVDGISAKAVDPSHSAMVDMSLGLGGFESYKTDEKTIGLDLEKIRKVLHLAKADSIVTVSHDEKENRLVVSVGNTTRKMGIIDISETVIPKIPNMNLPSKIVVGLDEIRQGLKAIAGISDGVVLTITPNDFQMHGKGTVDTVAHVVPKESLASLQCKETVQSLFALNYLTDMANAVPAETVALTLGQDYPMKLDFAIAGGKGIATFLLAPRIEET